MQQQRENRSFHSSISTCKRKHTQADAVLLTTALTPSACYPTLYHGGPSTAVAFLHRHGVSLSPLSSSICAHSLPPITGPAFQKHFTLCSGDGSKHWHNNVGSVACGQYMERARGRVPGSKMVLNDGCAAKSAAADLHVTAALTPATFVFPTTECGWPWAANTACCKAWRVHISYVTNLIVSTLPILCAYSHRHQ